jgi:hypothetical protein
MTPLTPSRVSLLLETTKVTKPACSAAKIRGRTTFCHGEAPDLVFWRASGKVSSENFRSIDFYSIDWLWAKFDRSNLSSIDRVLQNFRIFQAIPYEFCHSSLIDLQNIKTQKLTKASENNKAKGRGNYLFPHELPAVVNLPPWTDTSTKIEHPTTLFTGFPPIRQSDPLTPTVKGPCVPHVPTKPISFPFCPQPLDCLINLNKKKMLKEELEASSRHFRISHFNSRQ